MKKLLFPLMAILFLCACKKETSPGLISEEIVSKSAKPKPNKNTDVTIGTQIWMLENLDVTTYSNGDPIPQVTDPTEWANLTTGAWCYFINDPANGDIYGKIYNWYAVNDPRGLAPKKYHIPADDEWTTLTNYLGGEGVAGGNIKSTGTIEDGTGLWYSPNTGATNISGFTGLPGGYRDGLGSFVGIGIDGVLCSSTEFDASNAWYRALWFGVGSVHKNICPKQIGFSVRCIRD